jgi:putative Mg2+ transporter-C (MgtC) family protein
MNFLLEDILKLILAVLMGGLIGAEREFHDKAAGFRTLILICVGATLFTIFSVKLGGADNGTRIAANIVSGVGFLGAGVILRDAGRVVGLTTASAIWLTAAVGMGIGSGYYWLSTVAVFIVMLVLLVFPLLERRINAMREERTYEVVCFGQVEKFDQLEAAFKGFGLYLRNHKQVRSGTRLHWTWVLHGPPQAHERFIRLLMGDEEISEFWF